MTIRRWILSKIESDQRFDLVAILSLGVVVSQWFRGNYFIYVWDMTYPVNPAAYLRDFTNVWRSTFGTGFSDANGLTLLPYFVIAHFLQSYVGLSLSQAEAILFYCLFTGSGVGMCIFVRKFLSDSLAGRDLRIVGLVAGLFYMFNLYTLYYVWRIFSVEAFLLTFLPFMMYEIWQGLSKARLYLQIDRAGLLRYNLWSLLALPAFTNPGFLVTTAVLLGIVVLFAISQGPRRRKPLLHQVLFVVLLVGFWIGTNLWWLLPYGQNAGAGLARVGLDLLDLESNSIHSSLINVMRLQGMAPMYQQSPSAISYVFSSFYSLNPVAIAISSLIPLVSFGAMIGPAKVTHKARFAALVCLLSMFSAAGLEAPFGPVFKWLYQSLNFMIIFRDPYQKFGWVVLFCYSILFAIGIWKIRNVDFKAKRIGTKAHAIIPVVLVILVVGVYCWPFYNGDMITTGARVAIPDYYYSASSWFTSREGTYRVLSLPLDQVLQGSIWSHGYVGNDMLRAMTGRSVISTLTPGSTVDALENNMVTLMENNNTYVSNIFGLLNVKYVVIRNDADLNYARSATPPQVVASRVSSQNGVEYATTFGQLEVYENHNLAPRIYAVTNVSYAGSIEHPAGIGWELASYTGHWHTNDPNATLISSSRGISFSFPPTNEYPYSFFNNVEPLNVSIAAYPYLVLTFSTSNNSGVSIDVTSQSGSSSFLYALNPTPGAPRGTNYSSVGQYTLVFPLEKFFKRSESVDKVIINVTPSTPSPSPELGLTIDNLQFASYLGTSMDIATMIASSSFDKNRTAVTEQIVSPTLQGSAPQLDFDVITPSQYRVEVIGATTAFLLVFSETYDLNWELLFGPSPWGSQLAASHFKVNGYANAWLVHNLGTYTLTVSYKLQNNVSLGLYALATSMLLMINLVVYEPIHVFRKRFRPLNGLSRMTKFAVSE